MSNGTCTFESGGGVFRGGSARSVESYYRLYEEYLREWRRCASGDYGGVGNVDGRCRGFVGPEPPVWVGSSFGICAEYEGFGKRSVGSLAFVEGNDGETVVSEDVGADQGDGAEVQGVRACFGVDRDGETMGEFLSDDRVRGKNWKKNQRKKLNRRGRVSAVAGSSLGMSSGFAEQKPKDALRLSLEEKWRVENELKIAKAKKELDLLQSEDREAIKKLRDRKVQGATERTMVQIEKAHASLVQTGNVPGVQPGFCQTVVDGEIVESVPGLSSGESKECSISPSSSISEREVRELKKAYEDLKLEHEKLKRKQRRMPLAFRVALGEEDVPVSMVGGRVPESAKEALDEVIGEEEWTYEGDEDANPNLLYLRKELLF